MMALRSRTAAACLPSILRLAAPERTSTHRRAISYTSHHLFAMRDGQPLDIRELAEVAKEAEQRRTAQQAKHEKEKDRREKWLFFLVGALLFPAVGFMVNWSSKSRRNDLVEKKVELAKDEAARKHKDAHIARVLARLRTAYATEERESDIPGLVFDTKMQEARLAELRLVMGLSKPGALKLLEGPSGCGKVGCGTAI